MVKLLPFSYSSVVGLQKVVGSTPATEGLFCGNPWFPIGEKYIQSDELIKLIGLVLKTSMVQWSPAYKLEIGEFLGSTTALKHSVFFPRYGLVFWSKKFIS